MEQVQPVINKDDKVVSIGAFPEMNTQFPSPLQLLYMGIFIKCLISVKIVLEKAFFFPSKVCFYSSCLLIRSMKLACSHLEVTESKLQLFGFYLLLLCSSDFISG